MSKLLIKHVLRIAPFLYMSLIWIQSEYFQPESVMHLKLTTLVTLGVLLELAHLFQFGILYILLILAIYSFGPLTRGKDGLALITSILYAFTDEFHQYFVPFRSASSIDILKNLFGIALTWLFVRRLFPIENTFIGKVIKNVRMK